MKWVGNSLLHRGEKKDNKQLMLLKVHLLHIVHDSLQAFLSRRLPAQHHVVSGRLVHLQLQWSARNDAF